MSEPWLAQLPELFPSSKSSKPKRAWQLPRDRHETKPFLADRHHWYKSLHFARKYTSGGGLEEDRLECKAKPPKLAGVMQASVWQRI
jgi:hypothetical protein